MITIRITAHRIFTILVLAETQYQLSIMTWLSPNSSLSYTVVLIQASLKTHWFLLTQYQDLVVASSFLYDRAFIALLDQFVTVLDPIVSFHSLNHYSP